MYETAKILIACIENDPAIFHLSIIFNVTDRSSNFAHHIYTQVRRLRKFMPIVLMQK